MDSNPRYQYTPINGDDAIRLIILHPSPDFESKIFCSLISTTLHECDADIIENYTAISYVWGDSSSLVKISVDDRDLSITACLDSALRYLRCAKRSRRIWADAICINQSDYTEKSQQVRQMGEIYRTAEHTLIYLGGATAESDICFEYASSSNRSQSGKSCLDFNSDPEFLNRCIKDVFERTWFTRVWTYPELALSKNPYVQCGQKCVPWKALCLALEDLCRIIGPASGKLFRPIDDINKSFDGQLSKKEKRLPNPYEFATALVNAVQQRRGFGVFDQRDRIFAPLAIPGILPNTLGSELIEVNYAKPTLTVFQDFAIYAVQTTGTYNILYHTESPIEFEDRDINLPSWCPDWKVTGPRSRPRSTLGPIPMATWQKREPMTFHEMLKNRASGIVPVKAWLNPDDISLLVRHTWQCLNKTAAIIPCIGHSIGVVEALSSPITSPESTPLPLGTIEVYAALQYWIDFLKQSDIEFSSLRGRKEILKRFSVSEGRKASPIWLLEHLVYQSLERDQALSPVLVDRKVALIHGKNLALVPKITQVGDVICMIQGMAHPLIFHPIHLEEGVSRALEEGILNIVKEKIFSNKALKEFSHVPSTGHFKFVGEAFLDLDTCRRVVAMDFRSRFPELFVLH